MGCPNLLSNKGLIIQFGVIDIGAILCCTFTLICMGQIVKHKNESNAKGSNLFKYLLVKSAVELAVFLIDVFNLRYYTDPYMYTTFQGSVWSLYFVFYLELALFYVSSLMEIAATFDCLISVWNKWKFLLSDKAFYIVTAAIIVISFGFNLFTIFLYYIYEYTVVQVQGNVTIKSKRYWWKRSNFGFSNDSRNLLAAQVIIRDLVFLIILLALNGMILYEMKQVTNRRKKMTSNQHGSNTQPANGGAAAPGQPTSRAVQAAMNAERKKCIMILASGCMYFFGHILYAIYQMTYVVSPNTIYAESWGCVYQIGNDLIMISYGYSFFLYYFFNNQFKKFANDDLLLLIGPLFKLCGVDLTKPSQSQGNKSRVGGESTAGPAAAFTGTTAH